MLRSEFAAHILEGLVSTHKDAEGFLVKWMSRENTRAQWNPLATTMPGHGDNHFNSVGVRNYPDFKTGLDATLRTLRNGMYPHVVRFLTTGDTSSPQALNHELQRWSGNGYTFNGVETTSSHDDTVYGGGGEPSPPDHGVPSWYSRVLRATSPLMPRGQDVGYVQDVVGASRDGWYGPDTASHVRAFQSAHGLAADGVVGPDTAKAIG